MDSYEGTYIWSYRPVHSSGGIARFVAVPGQGGEILACSPTGWKSTGRSNSELNTCPEFVSIPESLVDHSIDNHPIGSKR